MVKALVCGTGDTDSTSVLGTISNMNKYKVTFRYIHNGQEAHEFVELDKKDTREPIDIVKEQWKGLMCGSGGLRNILSVEKA